VSQLDADECRDHIEVSPEAGVVASEIADRIAKYHGFALIADYGHVGEKTDTFRVTCSQSQTHGTDWPITLSQKTAGVKMAADVNLHTPSITVTLIIFCMQLSCTEFRFCAESRRPVSVQMAILKISDCC